MKSGKRFSFLVLFGVFCIWESLGQILTPEDLQMHRNQIYLDDDQMILFNGRGFASPRQYSVTGITSLYFFPIEWHEYDFWLNFKDKKTSTVIQDNTPELFRNGPDPLGCNFRPGTPMLFVTQDEVWQPNQYYREATFHKQIKDHWISFRTESWTSVSGEKDEVLLKVKIMNNKMENLDVTIQPCQVYKRYGDEVKNFVAEYGDYKAVVSSDLSLRTEEGFELSLKPGEEKICSFAVQIVPKQAEVDLYQPDIANRIQKAYNRTCERLALSSDRLPKIESEYKGLEELYKRCLITVNECKYERSDFVVNPFWASGTWPISMVWDQCFAEEALALLSPDGVKKSIELVLRLGKAEESYIYYNGTTPYYMLYLQDPFAIQTMIDAYITYTGDWSIMDEEVESGITVYEWMKRWTDKLRSFAREDGLIDVGYNTEYLIEIRTDGYNHVVPVINGLAADLYRWMADEAERRGDKDASQYRKWHDQLVKSMNEKLWNDELGWFENLYPDGTKGITWGYHLLDLLDKNDLSYYQAHRLIQHLMDGEFLAPYGMYADSKADDLHFDQVDTDWGGGGQYNGMTLRIAKNLFERGYGLQGWEILKRYAKYTDHFPYFTHNPLSDKMSQDHSSMSLQISAGAGLEAIFSGLFGVRPQKDGSICFIPYSHIDLGKSQLKDFRFRGNSYDVYLKKDTYEVWKNGKLFAVSKYGRKVVDQSMKNK